MVHVQRDTERLHLVVMNHEHIAGGSSVYEVINQYNALKMDEDSSVNARDRRFDVTLMINGLPMIHIELKNKQHSYMDGFWQIKKYIGEGKFTGIFSAVQMFVISNGVNFLSSQCHCNTLKFFHLVVVIINLVENSLPSCRRNVSTKTEAAGIDAQNGGYSFCLPDGIIVMCRAPPILMTISAVKIVSVKEFEREAAPLFRSEVRKL